MNTYKRKRQPYQKQSTEKNAYLLFTSQTVDIYKVL